MTYKIKNWNKFQHFKDRRPPWVKLYRDLLDDLEWFELDPVSSKNLINLWLIASEYDGCLPSIEILSFRLRLKKQEVERVLSCLSHWLEQDDISVISERYQDDRPEREKEREIEKEKELETKSRTPEGVSDLVFKDFVKLRNGLKAPVTETALKGLQREADKAGITLQAVLEICCQNGWRGFKADWIKDKTKLSTGDKNREIMSGLTRGLIGGNKDVQLLGK